MLGFVTRLFGGVEQVMYAAFSANVETVTNTLQSRIAPNLATAAHAAIASSFSWTSSSESKSSTSGARFGDYRSGRSSCFVFFGQLLPRSR